jgi:hypothetical protein
MFKTNGLHSSKFEEDFICLVSHNCKNYFETILKLKNTQTINNVGEQRPLTNSY